MWKLYYKLALKARKYEKVSKYTEPWLQVFMSWLLPSDTMDCGIIISSIVLIIKSNISTAIICVSVCRVLTHRMSSAELSGQPPARHLWSVSSGVRELLRGRRRQFIKTHQICWELKRQKKKKETRKENNRFNYFFMWNISAVTKGTFMVKLTLLFYSFNFITIRLLGHKFIS